MDWDPADAWNAAIGKLANWLDSFVQHLPNLVAAVVVFTLAWFVAKGVRSVVRRVLDRVTDHTPVKRLVATAVYVAVIAAGLFVALGVLELDKTVTSLLAGVGILGLALGFAFQDIAQNFIAGIMLSVRRPFREGDVVETNDYIGVVDHLDLRATVLRTFQGQIVRIPNSAVFQNPMVNFSTTRSRRVDVSVGVSYGDDLEKARRIAIEAVEGVGGRDTARDVELFYEAFGDSSIDFQVHFWIPFGKQADYLRARSEAIVRIKSAFDEGGVSIPFPIRTLDFSQVGGRRLAEELGEAREGDPAG